MWKKVGCVAVAGMLTVFGLTSCALTDLTKSIVEAVEYPEVYYVEYDVENEDNTVTAIAKGLDGEGNYYYKNATGEYIYDLEGNAYVQYKKENGGWQATGERVLEEYIVEATKEIGQYTEKSREKFNGQYEKRTTQTEFLGRSCDVYDLTIKLANFEQTYEMLVDDVTGICMKYTEKTSVNDSETGVGGFVCVEFEVENVEFMSRLQV